MRWKKRPFNTHTEKKQNKHELRRYSLLIMNRGHYCTKIHKCYEDALRRIVHLGLVLCRWQRRGTTTNVLRHFTRKNNKSNKQRHLPQ